MKFKLDSHIPKINTRNHTEIKKKMFCAVFILCLFVTRFVLGLDINVHADKLRVAPGEPVVLEVTVDDPTAEVECHVVHALDSVVAEFKGKPDAEGRLRFTFTPKEEWGYEARVTAKTAEAEASNSDVFACATSPYKVAVDYSVPAVYGQDVLSDGSPAPEGPVQNPHLQKRIAQQVAFFRHLHLTVGELMGPAFCSFSSIVPPVPNYFKGFHYNYSVNAVRQLVDELHANGIASVIYVNACVSGLAGTEFARRHPDFLAYNADGTPKAGLALSTREVHQDYVNRYPESLKQVKSDPAYRKQLTSEYPGFLNALLDFQDPDLARIGAEKIIEGLDYFGLDGVRYDGEYQVPSIGDPLAPSRDLRDWLGRKQTVGHEGEAMTVRNLSLAYDMLKKHNPDVLIGLNYAALRDEGALESAKVKVISPGFWILDEVAKNALNPSHPDHHWSDFIVRMTAQADRVRLVGDYLFAGWGGGPGQKIVDTKQIKAVSWACGLNWICGGYSKEQWFADVKSHYNRFALRYSQFIRDNRLQRLTPDEVEKTLMVQGSRPVLWEPFVYRLESQGKHYLIVHLINKPLEKGLTPDAQLPPAVEDLTLKLIGEHSVASVWFLSPDTGDKELVFDNGVAALPDLVNWGMVVIER